MKRKLIIDGNAVYEIDENCMLKNRLGQREGKERQRKDPVGKSRALKIPRQIAGEFCVQRQISIRIRYCCIHIRCFRIHCRIRRRRSEEG